MKPIPDYLTTPRSLSDGDHPSLTNSDRLCRLERLVAESYIAQGATMRRVEIKYRDPLQAQIQPASPGAAGIDLRCYPSDPNTNPLSIRHGWTFYAGDPDCLYLEPGQRAHKVSLGVSLALPSGIHGLILPRSGLGSRGLTLANSVGLIDSDYRGELSVCLVNTGTDTIKIQYAERILQLVLIASNPHQFEFTPVEKFSEVTSRGERGFGSTGNG